MKPQQLFLFDGATEPEKDPYDWWSDVEARQPARPSAIKRQCVFSSKEEYYKSEEWQIKRAFAINRASSRCQRCGATGILQVHHKTYDNLYNEKPEDLEVLCLKCHPKADMERAFENHYKSAFETYMCKKYGEEWDYYDGCEEEFEAWAERQPDLGW